MVTVISMAHFSLKAPVSENTLHFKTLFLGFQYFNIKTYQSVS